MGGPKLAVGTMCVLCAHVDIDILDILGCVYGRRWPRKSRESGNLYLQSLSSSPTKLLLHILIDQSAPKTLHALLKSLLQTSLPFCVSTCPTNCWFFASKCFQCNSCGYSQISAQNKFRCSLHVGTIVWNCCFSALYSPMSLVHCCCRASLPGGDRYSFWCFHDFAKTIVFSTFCVSLVLQKPSFLSLLSFHQFCKIIVFCRFSRFWLFQCNFQTQAGTFNLNYTMHINTLYNAY